jgi:predicted transcriptional regulator
MLDEMLGQSIIEITEKLRINKTFIAGYLEVLQKQGHIRLKRISPAEVYFTIEGAKWLRSM